MDVPRNDGAESLQNVYPNRSNPEFVEDNHVLAVPRGQQSAASTNGGHLSVGEDNLYMGAINPEAGARVVTTKGAPNESVVGQAESRSSRRPQQAAATATSGVAAKDAAFTADAVTDATRAGARQRRRALARAQQPGNKRSVDEPKKLDDSRTVAHLLHDRWKLTAKMTTPPGEYVKAHTKKFTSLYPQYDVDAKVMGKLKTSWEKLSSADKDIFRGLSAKHNRQIEVEVAKLDELIIAKRPGSRCNPYPPPAPPASTTEMDQWRLCPIWWYSILVVSRERVPIGRVPTWRADAEQHRRDLIKRWPSVDETIKRRCIERAQQEFLNDNRGTKGRHCGRREAAAAVNAVLARTLAEPLERIQLDDDGASNLSSQMESQLSV